MKRMRVLLCLLVPATALAVTYRVDPTGGPDGLGAAVAAAFAAWQGLDETLDVSESEDASAVFRYGDTALLGDDTLSLTVQRQRGERSLDILVTPTAGPLADNALLHEAGLLLDLAVSGGGVMNPALPEEPLALGESETAALQSLSAVKEDVNRDGSVDFYDLVALAQSFGQPGINAPADINDDGLVDRQDLELLRAAYVFAPPSATGPPEAEGAEDADPEDAGLETEGLETGGSSAGDLENEDIATGDPAENALPDEPFDENPVPADDAQTPLGGESGGEAP